MKIITRILLILTLTAVLVSCSDDNSSQPVYELSTEFEDLNVPTDFDWVTGNRIKVNVEINSQHLDIDLNGHKINLIDGKNEIVTSAVIDNMQASIPAVIPEEVSSLLIHIPSVNLTKSISPYELEQNVTIELSDVLTSVVVSNKEKDTRVNPIGNHDFEIDLLNDSPNANFEPPVDGEWYQYSAGTQDCDIVDDPMDGNSVLKMVPNCYATQSIDVNPNDQAFLTFSVRNPDENFVTLTVNFSYYDINGNATGTQALQLNSAEHDMDITWTEFSTAFVIPANSTRLTLGFHSHNFGIDYYFLDNIVYNAIGDSDGDNVNDNDDDYPNDPERAYRVVVPYTGRRIVAFEDLWPDKGDYDFNDMVIGTRFEYALNAQNQYVDLNASVRYRGLGAGYHNGLGVRFINVENNGSRNVYTPLTDPAFVKDSSHNSDIDPYEDNSIIITGDVFAQINTYYQNNGVGPDGTIYDRLFTVNFNTAATQPVNLVEDFFLYHAGHRGREIHLPNRPATAGADVNKFMTGDDATDPTSDYWYQTAQGHPWGIELLSTQVNFLHPRENVDITGAYPEFKAWAESGGQTNTSWYMNYVEDKIYNFED